MEYAKINGTLACNSCKRYLSLSRLRESTQLSYADSLPTFCVA